ncbi:MAG: NACHT domain-containing protein [Elainella sp. C42_A2020_010]|nr:NACHT domain-containing protein [Elainella sp. C42_A2020_010]
MDAPIRLEELYTAVQLLDRSELHYFKSTASLQDWFRQSGKRSFGFGKENRKSGLEVANQEQYLMVLGGPGVGKSTFLRKMGLEALRGKQGEFQHHCIPVFLALQRFKSNEISIEQLIARKFEVCGFPEAAEFVQAALEKGKLLVLLDGLDEVPLDHLDRAITQIQDLVDRYSQNRFIASCRVAAYKGGFPRFKDVAMAAFKDTQIEQFIRNWFRSAKDQEANTAEQCWELLKRSEYAAAKELAQTPLLLTLLCAVYDEAMDFPKNRAALYGEALDVLLRKWASEKRVQYNPIYQELSIELERELLADIAFDSFSADQLFFSKSDVIERIRKFLVSNLNAPQHLDSEKVLEEIEKQQGILVERARDAYSFSHLTFQEYLTAQYIVDNQQLEWLVTNHLTDERWQEVFLLVAGLGSGRKGSDYLLLLMEDQTRTLLDSPVAEPKLRPLLQWAEIATASSNGNYKPVARMLTVRED